MAIALEFADPKEKQALAAFQRLAGGLKSIEQASQQLIAAGKASKEVFAEFTKPAEQALKRSMNDLEKYGAKLSEIQRLAAQGLSPAVAEQLRQATFQKFESPNVRRDDRRQQLAEEKAAIEAVAGAERIRRDAIGATARALEDHRAKLLEIQKLQDAGKLSPGMAARARGVEIERFTAPQRAAEEARAAEDRVKAERVKQHAMDETLVKEGELAASAQKTWESTRTSSERALTTYKQRLLELNAQLKAGVIDQETHNRAVKQARDAYDQAGTAGRHAFGAEMLSHVKGLAVELIGITSVLSLAKQSFDSMAETAKEAGQKLTESRVGMAQLLAISPPGQAQANIAAAEDLYKKGVGGSRGEAAGIMKRLIQMGAEDQRELVAELAGKGIIGDPAKLLQNEIAIRQQFGARQAGGFKNLTAKAIGVSRSGVSGASPEELVEAVAKIGEMSDALKVTLPEAIAAVATVSKAEGSPERATEHLGAMLRGLAKIEAPEEPKATNWQTVESHVRTQVGRELGGMTAAQQFQYVGEHPELAPGAAKPGERLELVKRNWKAVEEARVQQEMQRLRTHPEEVSKVVPETPLTPEEQFRRQLAVKLRGKTFEEKIAILDAEKLEPGTMQQYMPRGGFLAFQALAKDRREQNQFHRVQQQASQPNQGAAIDAALQSVTQIPALETPRRAEEEGRALEMKRKRLGELEKTADRVTTWMATKMEEEGFSGISRTKTKAIEGAERWILGPEAWLKWKMTQANTKTASGEPMMDLPPELRQDIEKVLASPPEGAPAAPTIKVSQAVPKIPAEEMTLTTGGAPGPNAAPAASDLVFDPARSQAWWAEQTAGKGPDEVREMFGGPMRIGGESGRDVHRDDYIMSLSGGGSPSPSPGTGHPDRKNGMEIAADKFIQTASRWDQIAARFEGILPALPDVGKPET